MEQLTFEQTLELRKQFLAPSCTLFYKDAPLKIVKASGQYMFDHNGNKYLDCANNVAHVGHCHPKVVQAECGQAPLLNTNSRFLHENLPLCAQKLCSLLPEPLSVCFLCNSGSEANDLALQLAKCHTVRDHVIAVDHAYHGHLTSTIQISPYKFRQRKRYEKKEGIHIVPCPDSYRGKYRGDNVGPQYAEEVKKVLTENEGKVAAFICESLLSCAGQIIPPKDYFRHAYKYVKEAGGVCIADEVQVGFGRVGTHYWAFQLDGDDILPDIVTVGKPLGNGHPISAVITTHDIANSFYANGGDYFNTFGGNPVSCAIALSVMNVVEKEELQKHALEVGAYTLNLLKQLNHRLIGDIRGVGLFIGIELVRDPVTKEPATAEAKVICERLKQEYVIVSRDGPDENVLKLKPPMVFNKENADFFAQKLDTVLTEIENT